MYTIVSFQSPPNAVFKNMSKDVVSLLLESQQNNYLLLKGGVRLHVSVAFQYTKGAYKKDAE